jgi:ribosomal protein S18 acetylase RimI-like enzyme
MPTDGVEVRPTIDRNWLERVGREEPVLHAFALWDLDQAPTRVRFASAVRGSTTVGYLLIWPLAEGGTVVHWLGEPELTAGLLDHLPARPLLVLCSEAAGPAVERARGPTQTRTVLAEMAPLGAPAPAGPQEEMVRRLTGDDRPLLRTFATAQADRIGTAYAEIDPATDPVWAGFERGRIVALARPAARLPHIWIVGGVYVAPDHRSQGWGRAVVRSVMVEATRAGAPCGLFVREESAPARALYESLGYRPVARRLWMDAGLGREP